jgi:hypothetical protein
MDESSKETSGERPSQEPEAAKPTNDAPAGDTPETPAGEKPEAAPDASTAGPQAAGVPAVSGGQLPPAPARHGAVDGALPVVWSPNLGGDEVNAEEILESPASEHLENGDEAAADEPAASTKAAAPQRSLRFAMVALALAGAAAVGSFIGSLSATGVEHFWPVATTNPAPVRTAAATKAESSEISTLKANLDAAARGANGQLAKLAERLERLERGQAEPAAKIARVAEALDRLEKKNAAAASVSAASAAPETTGSIPSAGPTTAEARLSEKVLPDWIVREARGGRALVENRFGGMFDIATGSVLPGLGRVESVRRQDGQWIVVTAHGVIYSAP